VSTIVHFECRNPDHRRGVSRRGVGGLVIRHGSVGYCDGADADGAHRWIPTGGVPIELLYEHIPDAPSAEHASEPASLRARPFAGGTSPRTSPDGAQAIDAERSDERRGRATRLAVVLND